MTDKATQPNDQEAPDAAAGSGVTLGTVPDGGFEAISTDEPTSDDPKAEEPKEDAPKTEAQEEKPNLGVSEPGYVAPAPAPEEDENVVIERHVRRMKELLEQISNDLPQSAQVGEVKGLLASRPESASQRGALFQRLAQIENELSMDKRWKAKEVVVILRELGVTP